MKHTFAFLLSLVLLTNLGALAQEGATAGDAGRDGTMIGHMK